MLCRKIFNLEFIATSIHHDIEFFKPCHVIFEIPKVSTYFVISNSKNLGKYGKLLKISRF